MKRTTLLITGAASGLGRALALKQAKPGATLHLVDHDALRLQDTVARAEALGARCEGRRIDVRDATEMQALVSGCRHLDLVIACAGVTGGVTRPAGCPTTGGAASLESERQVRAMIETNLLGVINTVMPAIDVIRFQPRADDGLRGRICAISSVAGVVSFPGTPSYCATKAAVDRFMVATGGNLRREGVLLSSVVCGFISTPMANVNEFHMPGLTQVQHAADRIMNGLNRNKRRIVFPRWLVVGSRLMDMLPISLAEKYYLNQPVGAAGTLCRAGDPS
ncbi:oxidoreductase [Acetobacter nitrogenifigens DSM 23921 = NBRC 105050]|uniref:SDR family oxidoreductase n=1 Tax=Acetobacter nitrogenifigens DSM 23921 = NBRC 105050 TaxID=1120919 RepID=A0A511X7V0_9PROT|nr:SDR family NAD(P)-dependent oxidoreductase [Acetobacter nitrogenifigens]GBQ88950.1 oxidoreductase [Acetobacter nitrogenifigens DSM 23921 = NBRC 105050]GEN59023.1 SDR family oxidoreductase [Acetobacter nitrogenifigens DSM 23921 = NBRC 105050]